MITLPVMEVEAANSSHARLVPRIMTGEVQGQLPVHVTPQT